MSLASVSIIVMFFANAQSYEAKYKIIHETLTKTIVSVSAGLPSGSINCPQTNIMKANISFTYSGSHVNEVDFFSEVSYWDEAMHSISSGVIADVNADIDSVLN